MTTTAKPKTFTLKRGRQRKLNLANIKISVESGNPYRNAGTGKFGFELPGVRIIGGKRYLKGMETEAKNALAARVKTTNAREMLIKQDPTTGELTIVLGNQGRILDSFTIAPPQPVEGVSPEKGTGPPSNRGKAYEAAFDPEDEKLRDAIVEASRNLGLDETQVVASIEQRIGRELSDAEKFQLKEEIDRQRLEDLVQYLHTNLDRKLEKGEQGDRVRIRTPRGYLRRTFAKLDKVQAQKVIDRLRNLGWSDEELENNVQSGMPKRLKKEMGLVKDEDKNEGKNE